MDWQFDMSFVIDDDNRLTNAVHDLTIIEEYRQDNSGVEYRQTIDAIGIHLAITLLLSENDPIAHQSQGVHVQCTLI